MSSVVISGDTSGAITVSAPAVAGTTTLTLPATTGTVLNDATCGVCRAWVNFNGTGTVAIRGSFNVTSITDNSTGNYTVNLTTAMADINYSICGAVGNITNADKLIMPTDAAAPTTSAFRIGSTTFGGTYNDNPYVWAAVFR
jgi:hypothetical protein